MSAASSPPVPQSRFKRATKAYLAEWRAMRRKMAPAVPNSYQRPQWKHASTPYRGVTKVQKNGRFVAVFRWHGKNYHVGTFATDVEAARAYDRKALEVIGPEARLNFPGEDGGPPCATGSARSARAGC